MPEGPALILNLSIASIFKKTLAAIGGFADETIDLV